MTGHPPESLQPRFQLRQVAFFGRTLESWFSVNWNREGKA